MRCTQQRRGFATVMVIITLILVAAAITSLGLLLATDNRRTKSATAGAQLRQLLLAAAPVAGEELRLHGSAARDIAVPTPVAGAVLTLHVSPLAADRASVRVTAKSTAAVWSQTLVYARTNNDWRLQSASLSGEP